MATITFEKLFDSLTETQITTEDVNPGGNRLSIGFTPIITVMKILVLATNIDSVNVRSGISLQLNAMGYVVNRDYTITSKNVSSSYTGSGDITSSNPPYNIVVIVTNSGGTSDSTFGTNLNTYVNNGFHLIMMTFCWNIAVAANSTFDYNANNPLTYTNNQSYDNNNVVLTQVASHPILTNSSPSLNIGADHYNGNVALTSGATSLAIFPSTGTIAIAVREKGTSRLVAFNFYPGDLTTTTGTLKNRAVLLTNGVLWCGQRI